MSLKNFLYTFQARSTYLKRSPEPGLSNARWIECLRCVKHKLTLTKAQRASNFVLSSHIWSLMARSVYKSMKRKSNWRKGFMTSYIQTIQNNSIRLVFLIDSSMHEKTHENTFLIRMHQSYQNMKDWWRKVKKRFPNPAFRGRG